MLVEAKLIIWILTGLLAVMTVFFNVYIFLMSLWSKKEKKQRGPSDTIIIALSAADVTHQLMCYLWMTMDEVDTKCRMADMIYTILLLLIFSFKFTIMWDTSFLTFYYSTKLVNTPNHCYTQIQAAILKHVTLAIILIPLCGLVTCMPMLVVFHHDNSTGVNKDCGVLMPDTSSGQVYNVIYLLMSDVLPGLIMLKCCVSISVHLAIHLRHMKASTNGAHLPKLGSQMRVIKMALSLVAVFLIFLVVDLYVNYQIVVYNDSSMGLTFFVTSIYTTVTAMVLIYGKKTLWKALIHDFNICLDEYPCLSCLKVPERKATSRTPAKVIN
ncbi:taste receptor, type 2, member 202 [Leuresthes tenuis]|uniref:taste receptor, type 2, member 202 n=1 Tax=Leuresthes tenuis TaxID=355514 RepID=UPI003B5014FF